MAIENYEEVLTSKRLVAQAPLDNKTVIDTLVNRNLIPDIERFQGFTVFVQENGLTYALKTADLSNNGWSKAYDTGTGYLGGFDPNTSPSGVVKDNNDILFSEGDYAVVNVATLPGFPYNFTTGDLSPDAGGQHIEDLLVGQEIKYGTDSIWEVFASSNIVTSVNSEIGDVVLDAEDILIDPITGLAAAETQSALEELKTITDGLGLGSIYFGLFDPANPPAPPFQPQDGNINYNSGNFFITSVDGHWNFTTGDQTNNAGADNEFDLVVGDQIRVNLDLNWDLIPSQATPPGGQDTAIQFNANGVFGGSALFTWDGSGVSANAGVDSTHKFGHTLIDGRSANAMTISNAAQTAVAGYAIRQNVGGTTDINAAIGADLRFSIGNVIQWELDQDGKLYGKANKVFQLGSHVATPVTAAEGQMIYQATDKSVQVFQDGAWVAIGDSTPAGADTQIQFNALGEFGASADFAWFNSTKTIVIKGTGGAGLLIQEVAANRAILYNLGGGTLELYKATDDSRSIYLQAGISASYINTGFAFGIGTATPNLELVLDLVGVSALSIPKGTTLERPATPVSSLLRFNTDDVAFEGYDGVEWGALGGGGSSFAIQNISHSVFGALDIDFANGSFAIVNLTANVTALTISGDDGQGQILFVQDAVGGRVVNFAGNETVDGSIPDYSVAVNAKSLIDVVKASGSTYMLGAGNLIANA
jgi:hypothetical protein